MHIAGDTPISRCDPRVKIVLLMAFSVAVLVVRSWWGIGALACMLAFVLALAQIPARRIGSALIPVYVIAAVSLAFNVIADPDAMGLATGLFVALRMIVLVAGSFAVCFTTTATQLVDALRSLMKPLRAVRVPVDDIAFALTLAVRFVPVIGEEVMRIRSAQAARAVEHSTGLRARLRRWGNTFVSVFVGLFRRADSLSRAMDARCYGASARRTSLNALRMSSASAAILIVGLAALVLFCVFL